MIISHNKTLFSPTKGYVEFSLPSYSEISRRTTGDGMGDSPVSVSWISRILSGRDVNPTQRTLNRIAVACGVELRWIVGYIEMVKRAPSTIED